MTLNFQGHSPIASLFKLFYPRDAMLARVLAVGVCVCAHVRACMRAFASVTHIVSKRLDDRVFCVRTSLNYAALFLKAIRVYLEK